MGLLMIPKFRPQANSFSPFVPVLYLHLLTALLHSKAEKHGMKETSPTRGRFSALSSLNFLTRVGILESSTLQEQKRSVRLT